MEGYIYKVTNTLNGKIYIGQKTSSFFRSDYFGSGSLIRAAILYYGIDHFKVELLEEVLHKSDLDSREIYWINFYNSTNLDIGYNISRGGKENDYLCMHKKDLIFPEEIQTIRAYKKEQLKKIKQAKKDKIVKSITEEITTPTPTVVTLSMPTLEESTNLIELPNETVTNDTETTDINTEEEKIIDPNNIVVVNKDQQISHINLIDYEKYHKEGWEFGYPGENYDREDSDIIKTKATELKIPSYGFSIFGNNVSKL